ncbi:retrotransposon protein, putative, ty1-copia subclass [Tanacetum coccineum]
MVHLRVVETWMIVLDTAELRHSTLVGGQMTTSVVNNSVFRGFFEKQKLTGPNFIDCSCWSASCSEALAAEALAAHAAWVKGSKENAGLMLMTMEPNIQQNLENLSAYEMLQELKTLFTQQRAGTSSNCTRLSLLQAGRRVNYNRHSMGRIINELHAILKLHEQTLPKNNTLALHAIRAVSRNNMVYFSAIPRDEVFKIDLSDSYTNVSSTYALSNKRAKSNLDSALLWHCRLGHISKKRIKKLQHDGLLNSTDLMAFEKCFPCMSEKMARKPYTHQVERVKDLLGLIYTNVCGPFKIVSRQGASYFVAFTDDFSRYGYVYLLKHKHEVFETFKVFQNEVENQLGKTIKSLHSDHGGEYMSQEFLNHLKDHGIIAHRTPPYTPQHNGVSERRNRTLLDMVRSMMSQTTLPKSFWDYALETAARILNMVLTKKSLEDLEIIQEEDTHPSIDTSLHHEEDDLEIDKPQSDINPIRRSTRTCRPIDRLYLYIDAEEHELGDLGEPANYKAALLDTESDEWLNAMNVEMQSMKNNEVWDLVDLHPNGKTVRSKWLFKKKTDMDGAETFSHVADIRAIRILIAITAFYDYEIWQMDVKTAFLNGYLSEEVYMEKPEASGSNVTFLILYVDDILIMGNNIPMLQGVKSYLGRCFAMKDLGEVTYILGIKFYRDRSRWLIGLCQSAYIEKFLKRYHMENSKRGSIPMQDKLRLSKSQGASTPAELKRMQNVPYASAVGSIMYAVRCTRPDVAFA